MTRAELARIALKKAFEIPANCASHLIAMPRIASHLDGRYNRVRDAHRSRVPDLPSRDRPIVTDLRTNGVHVSSLAALDLPGSDVLLAEGRRLYERYCGDGRPGHSPLVRSFQAGAADVMANRGIFFWGLQDRLLDIVEAYLGVPVGFDGLNIFFTKADGLQTAARRWHRDTEDRQMVKIAVYMNDVDDEGGPLQVLRRNLPDHERTIRGKFPVLKQLELETRLPGFEADRDVVTCLGKAGTVVFADTASRYHRGKPATGRDRCVVYFNYFHQVPLRPFRCERSTLSRSRIAELAADLPRRQRDSLLWRSRLPAIARLVPPAPIWD